METNRNQLRGIDVLQDECFLVTDTTHESKGTLIPGEFRSGCTSREGADQSLSLTGSEVGLED